MSASRPAVLVFVDLIDRFLVVVEQVAAREALGSHTLGRRETSVASQEACSVGLTANAPRGRARQSFLPTSMAVSYVCQADIVVSVYSCLSPTLSKVKTLRN